MRPRESKIFAFMRSGPDIRPYRHLLGFRSTAASFGFCVQLPKNGYEKGGVAVETQITATYTWQGNRGGGRGGGRGETQTQDVTVEREGGSQREGGREDPGPGRKEASNPSRKAGSPGRVPRREMEGGREGLEGREGVMGLRVRLSAGTTIQKKTKDTMEFSFGYLGACA